jgi:hypothetical protein
MMDYGQNIRLRSGGIFSRRPGKNFIHRVRVFAGINNQPQSNQNKNQPHP